MVETDENGEGAGSWEPKELIRRAERLWRHYRVTGESRFRLKDVDPGDTPEFTAEDKPRSKEALAAGIRVLAGLARMIHEG